MRSGSAGTVWWHSVVGRQLGVTALRGLAWAVVSLALLLPLAHLTWHSLQVTEVVTTEGEVIAAVGRVETTPKALRFATQQAPGEERVPERFAHDEVREVRTVIGLRHHRFVLEDPRLGGLLANTVGIASVGALLALLLGLGVAWLWFRTDLPGRHLLGALGALPLLLPPFFLALGGARRWQRVLGDAFGWEGASLQRAGSALTFGLVLYPFVALLVGPAWARLPRAPHDAARLLGGPRLARRIVTRPALLPVLIGAFLLVFVLALADFAVPDLLGFMLPGGGAPAHVFATEILLQWKQQGNVARAAATALPALGVMATLVGVALVLLRRSALFEVVGPSGRVAPYRLALRGRVLAGLAWVLLLGVALVVPFAGIASWAGTGGETLAQGSSTVERASAPSGSLGDFSGALDRTEGSRAERDRWLRTSLLAAALALLVSVPLIRHALRGGRAPRIAVVALGALGLATPALVLSAGAKLMGVSLGWDLLAQGDTASVLALTGRMLPFALLLGWLALRSVPVAQEESAALLGAGPWSRFVHMVLRPALPMLILAFFVLCVVALRELEAIMLIDARILPLRLYDKIHFSRLADEANLLFLCVAIQLIPMVLVALLAAWSRGRRSPGTHKEA